MHGSMAVLPALLQATDCTGPRVAVGEFCEEVR